MPPASKNSGPPKIKVRPATHADLDTLARFSAAMAKETEGRTLDEPRLRQGVRAVLDSPERGRYLVAAAGTTVVGQMLITYEWSDWRNGVFWWIQSVYVDPPARRRGVYRHLHAHVLKEARASREVCGVRLYVEKENAAAQATYARLGMSPTAYQVFEQDFVL